VCDIDERNIDTTPGGFTTTSNRSVGSRGLLAPFCQLAALEV